MDLLGFPEAFRWQKYSEAWVVGRFSKHFLNSIIVSVPIVLIPVALPCLGGYALARFRVKGAILTST